MPDQHTDSREKSKDITSFAKRRYTCMCRLSLYTDGYDAVVSDAQVARL